MNPNAIKRMVRRGFKMAPKVAVKFESYSGHYNPTTGKDQDAKNVYAMEGVVRKKTLNRKLPDSVVFLVDIAVEDFEIQPVIDDVLIIADKEYTIHSFEISMLDQLYSFAMVA